MTQTPVTDMVRDQQGDYLVAVEDLEASHATLLAAAKMSRCVDYAVELRLTDGAGGHIATLIDAAIEAAEGRSE